MSNFTKALKDLTGFGDDERKDFDSAFSETDEALKFADSSTEVMPEAVSVAQASKPVEVKAPVIPIDTIDIGSGATLISRAMIVEGTMDSDEDIVLEGYISGDVKTTHSFKSSGVQVGTVKADRIAFTDAKHKGNIDVEELLTINANTVIVGDIKCKMLKMDGRVKGNLDVENETLLLDNACIVGNVSTGKINPAPGARISGSIVLRAALTEIEDDFDIDIDFDFGGEN